MPPEPSSPSSLRNGMHDLRNVLNAVQINAFAARQLVDDATRTLACIARIESAVQRGADLLHALPTEETLSSAGTILLERLRDAGGLAEVSATGADDAPVPGLLRQALCLVAVESQSLGARAFRLSIETTSQASVLSCEAEGLRAPGPIARALGGSDLAELHAEAEPLADGWLFRWTIPAAR
jgi:hypothetical protein